MDFGLISAISSSVGKENWWLPILFLIIALILFMIFKPNEEKKKKQ